MWPRGLRRHFDYRDIAAGKVQIKGGRELYRARAGRWVRRFPLPLGPAARSVIRTRRSLFTAAACATHRWSTGGGRPRSPSRDAGRGDVDQAPGRPALPRPVLRADGGACRGNARRRPPPPRIHRGRCDSPSQRSVYSGTERGWKATPVLHHADLEKFVVGSAAVEEYDATCLNLGGDGRARRLRQHRHGRRNRARALTPVRR